jgi:hypothetical protein
LIIRESINIGEVAPDFELCDLALHTCMAIFSKFFKNFKEIKISSRIFYSEEMHAPIAAKKTFKNIGTQI